MTTQNYCMVNETTNICDNVTVWDGNPQTWTPPAGYLMLVQATTPSKNWVLDIANQVYVLTVEMGCGFIGFTWDGTYLITDQAQPAPPDLTQATVTGAQTL